VDNIKDFGEEFLDSEEEALVGRYEDMLAQGRACYFDVSECEEIIDYYRNRYELEKAMQAVNMAEKLHPLALPIQLMKASLFAFCNKPRKALNIILRLEQSKDMHDLDLFGLKLTKAYALILVGKIREALALQQDMLDNEAADNFDVEQVLFIMTSGLLTAGKYEEVIQNLQRFEGKMQLSPELLGSMASAYAELDNVGMAVEYYKKGIAQDPFDPAMWCDLADMQEDSDEAMTAYDYALLLDEKMPQAYCGKAALLSEMGMEDEAGALLLKGINTCPYDADLYDMLMAYYEATEDYDGAMQCCKKMIGENPYNPYLWIGFARACCYMERYEEALEACDTTVLLNEDMSADMYEVKASIYQAMGLPDKELEMYEKMLKCDVHDLSMVYEIGALYEDRGEPEVAYKIYADAIYANPDDAHLFFRMAVLLDSANMVEEAYRCAQRAVALDRQNSRTWGLLATLQRRKGDRQEMLHSLKQSLTGKEGSAAAIVLLYELIVKDKESGAMPLLKYAEKSCRSIPVALPHCYMAALYFSLCSIEKCLRSLEQALSIDADCSPKAFFEICPKAKKIPEVKNLCRLYKKNGSS
jgi:tetratricopeptide (TPR) repeat protein